MPIMCSPVKHSRLVLRPLFAEDDELLPVISWPHLCMRACMLACMYGQVLCVGMDACVCVCAYVFAEDNELLPVISWPHLCMHIHACMGKCYGRNECMCMCVSDFWSSRSRTCITCMHTHECVCACMCVCL